MPSLVQLGKFQKASNVVDGQSDGNFRHLINQSSASFIADSIAIEGPHMNEVNKEDGANVSPAGPSKNIRAREFDSIYDSLVDFNASSQARTMNYSQVQFRGGSVSTILP